MVFEIPQKVEIIINILEKAGYEAYAVGGCVRDALLGRTPNDWDITTSAKPEQVKALFHRTVDTGIAHGTVTVLLEKEGFEVTTYRVDGEYEDGREPFARRGDPEWYHDREAGTQPADDLELDVRRSEVRRDLSE